MQPAGPPRLLACRYRLDQRRATGGYGEVWRATDTLLRRTVAIKLLRAEISGDGDTQARFRGEARLAGSVSHENIAQVYDYCEAGPDQPAFLVMEYVDGPSLAEVLDAGPMEPALAMDVVARCAAGLHAAHQAGLVHRDIKPGNVLMAEGRRVKLTDFGISHVAGSAPVTATGALIGTPAYLAPERANGASGAAASDLYSLGVLAYQCLTGEVPFSGDALAVALAHCTRPLPPLPETVPAGVAALVGALTAKDPADRPKSAAAVRAWAAGLRDQLRTGAPGIVAGTEPGMVAGTRDDNVALPPMPDAATLRPAAYEDGPTRRRWRRYAVLLPAAAIVAALTAVLLLSMIDQSPQHVAAAPSQGTMVMVDGKTLLGRPVPAARRQLRRLGLNVQVRWRPSNRIPPGRVLSVRPAGLVPRDTTVVLVGTLAPGHPAGPGRGLPPGHHKKPGTPGHGRPHSGGGPPVGGPTPTGGPTPVGSPTPTASSSPTPSPSTTPTPAAGRVPG